MRRPGVDRVQFAVDRGLRPDNPAKGVKKSPVRKMQPSSEAEFARLAEALTEEGRESGNPFVVGVIRTLAFTGAGACLLNPRRDGI